jgi:hypothetical protein
MKEKYLEKALIKEVRIVETPLLSKPHEGTVSLLIIKKDANAIREFSFECFIYGDDALKFNKDETVSIELILTNWAWKNKKIEENEQKIELSKGTSVLEGKIVDIGKSKYEDSLTAVVDCGVYIKTRLLKNQNLKISDYIRAEGRLDAHIVDEKQEGDTKSGDDLE